MSRTKFNRAKTRGFSQNLHHFGGSEFALLNGGEFSGDNPNLLEKSALVMVEGTHRDSAKKTHKFPASRIIRLVKNTNEFLFSGGRVPWQRDHDKTQKANIGDLEGELEARRITKEDLPDERLQHLVGRLGVFASRLVAKGADVCQEIAAGRIKTLSPGIDVSTDTIMEISATPTPAIVGLMTFRRGEGNFAVTWDELEQESQDIDQLRESFDTISGQFWDLSTNILSLSEDELGDADPNELIQEAMNGYFDRISQLLGLDSQDPSQSDGTPEGSPDNQFLQKQQQDLQKGANMAGNLTLADMARSMYGTAEFAKKGGLRARAARASNAVRSIGRKKKPGLAGRVLGTTAGGRMARLAGIAALAAGARYGVPAVASSINAMKDSNSRGAGPVYTAGAGVRAAARNVQAGVGGDVRRGRDAVMRGASAVRNKFRKK